VSHPTDRSSGLKYASVCDGIGAAHVAWQPLGWQCQWTSEIEPFPVAVVEHHYGFRNLGDMTAITEEMLDAPVELLVGGTPCQSFSVAGLRGGLADPRGNLALRFVQLAAVMQPRWIVWENVPGVLSSGQGRDFGTFLGALGELGYGFAYRILDAQWFGVAQRRRRVFVVGHLGDWRRAAAVLFERESVFGNPPTRGATGQGITSSPEGIAGNVSSKWAKGTGGPAGDECYNLVAEPFTKSKRAQSTTDDETWVPGEVSPTMSCFDQGDTRATTVVTTPIDLRQASRGEKVTNNRAGGSGGPPGHGVGEGGDPAFTVSERGQAVAFTQNCRDEVRQINGDGQIAGALSADSGSHQTNYVAYDVHGTLATKGASQTDFHTALRSRPPGQSEASTTTVVAVVNMGGDKGGASTTEDGSCFTLSTNEPHAVAAPMAVRRLTPRECERLQGFPDDYTLVEYRKKPAADGPRYRALGNSMAVPVMRWIGERIAMVDRMECP
jgi:DNA (cytosine-5)-methyltransferase 1